MNVKPIKTEVDYKDALKRLEVIFDSVIGTPESDEADVLGLMIDEYEEIIFKFTNAKQAFTETPVRPYVRFLSKDIIRK